MIGKLAIVTLVLSACLRADDLADRQIATGIGEFTRAFAEWDGPKFAKAAETFRNASVKSPTSAAAHYWQGTARFHRMLYLENPSSGGPDAKAAESERDAAIACFDAALKLDGDHAESHALIGTLYGMKIKGGLLGAIRYGPSVQEHQQKALQSGATNPRVKYLLGAGQYHTSKDQAGYQEALNSLLAAEKLFTHESKRAPKPLAPRWGFSSCLTFIGKTHEKLGKPDQALVYYRKAIAMHPADHTAGNGIKRLTKN